MRQRTEGRLIPAVVALCLAALCLAAQGCAGQDVSPEDYRILKVWAGEMPAPALGPRIRTEMKAVAGGEIVMPTESVVSCDSQTVFLVSVLVIAPSRQWLNVEQTWEFPHIAHVYGQSRHHRSLTLRKHGRAVFGPESFRWRLHPNERIDGNIRFELSVDGRTEVSHIFRVRGCPRT